MAINWGEIGDQKFNIEDPYCGFWTDKGFTKIQKDAKVYTQSELSEHEKTVIDTHKCLIWSA